MTKRSGQFNEKNSKKTKLNEDIEAFWGDDIDEGALDDCIKLASQVYQQEKITCTQLNNVTLLPTYSAFKQKNGLFCSTQFTQPNISVTPSTSKYEFIPKKSRQGTHFEKDVMTLQHNTSTQFTQPNSVRPSTSKYEYIPKKLKQGGDFEKDVITLQQQYKEKEGEISILRSQLQEAKTNFLTEQQKLQNEMKQKLTQTERQMKSVKSELEFKNLEIANLKQKILEITKHNILDTSLNGVQNNVIANIKQEITVTDEVKVPSNILQPILDPIYPLKDVISEKLFDIHKREQHITEMKITHSCKNAIPYLQNQSVSSNVVVDKSGINISCVYSDILKLIYCSEGELNRKEIAPHLNKIVCACEQFMYDLQTFLEQIKDNLRTEDILEADSSYLKQQDGGVKANSDGCERDEIGVKSSVLLNFLAELLPYNEYLMMYVCREKPLIFGEKDDFQKQFPYLRVKEQSIVPCYFLNTILNIIRIAGEIRKANFMSKFFNSTIKLLINIHKSRNYDYVSNIFCELTKEVVFSRPPVEVILEITFLFKAASQHSSFIEFLLNKSEYSATSKKGILYFNEDACRFYIFVMLFDNTVFGRKNDHFPLNVCLNMLCFMYNTFKNCYWIHHRNVKECECIPQLYKLQIEIASRALEEYVEETKRTNFMSSEWAHFFKNPITAKVLNLMTFNAYEVTEKYVTVLSQYKQIEKTLQEKDYLIELEKLNITEELVEIPSDAFKNVDF